MTDALQKAVTRIERRQTLQGHTRRLMGQDLPDSERDWPAAPKLVRPTWVLWPKFTLFHAFRFSRCHVALPGHALTACGVPLPKFYWTATVGTPCGRCWDVLNAVVWEEHDDRRR